MCPREENVIETFNLMMKKKLKETSVVILDDEIGESNTDEVISCSYSPEGVDPAPLPGDYIKKTACQNRIKTKNSLFIYDQTLSLK